MPRRPSARTSIQNSSLTAPSTSSPLPTSTSLPDDLRLLRTQWKWAAFSQFFFTFSPIFAMDDVTIKDVEDDLVFGSSIVLPRIMVRLLYTLSYDRKVNLDNWQTTLRRQYNKRDPNANPIGPEPVKDGDSSRYASVVEETASPEPEGTKAEDDGDGPSTNPTADEATDFAHSPSNEVTSNDETHQVKDEEDDEQLAKPSRSRRRAVDELRVQPDEEKETKDWLSLPMLEKLDSLHLLVEWQFQSPNRIRTLMKSDDEQATWRIEPIGYDAKRNAYWLIGADRLWIQREKPKPSRPTTKNSLKRKRGAANSKSAKSKSSASSKRPRLQVSESSTPKRGRSAPKKEEPTPSSTRRGRAAKEQANKKLDAQAKELAELNRQAALLAKGGSSRTRSSARSNSTRQQSISSPAPSTPGASRTRSTRASAAASRPLGTRISARLRGVQDDEWQAIPEEWLNGGDKGKSREASPSEENESDEDSVSELTELSEESEEKPQTEKSEEEEEENEQQTADDDAQQDPPVSDGFIEWETIAVTLEEWEHIAERWQKATHYAEKALYKVLTTTIVPVIVEELRAIENKRRMEEAIVHRKRSSRIALKESEKEEARMAARKKAEEEEKMGRARRAEARQRKEEAERAKREQAREQRRKEREDREALEARQAEEKERKQKEKEEREKDQRSQRKTTGSVAGSLPLTSNGVLLLHPQRSNYGSSLAGSTSGSRTPAGDDWELDCEICHRRGINLDDGTPMMCCGLCSKWQHITCHDQADMQAGRPRRNWDEVDFVCRQCRSRAAGINASGGYRNTHGQQQYPPLHQNAHLSLRIPPASHSPAPYNHVPYGQGISNYDAGPRMSNGFTDVHGMNSHSSKGYGVSDVRSALPAQSHPPQKQISFSHYQPQHQGFSSRTTSQGLPQYNNPATHVQAYGQASSLGQYPQYANSVPTNHTNPYLQTTGWNARHSTTQPLGYPSTSSYVASAERSSAASSTPYQQQQWHPHHSTQTVPPNGMPYTSYQSSS